MVRIKKWSELKNVEQQAWLYPELLYIGGVDLW